MPTYYPIFLDLTQRRCLVVGGGAVAERKVHGLLEAQADVTVVSPTLTEALRQRATTEVLHHVPRPFQEQDIAGHALVIAATDQVETNSRVAAAARRGNIWVNVVDTPDACDFIAPAVVRRGSLHIAISTGGKSPLLAKRLRQAFEALIGPEFAELTEVLGALRTAAHYREVPGEEWRAMFQRVIDASCLPLLADVTAAETP